MTKKGLYIGGFLVVTVSLFIFVFWNFSGYNFRDQDKVKVTTSFYPLYFLATEIAGDKAEVYNITPAGADPHEFDLTPGSRVRIENSDLLLLVGGNFEPWGKRLQEILAESETTILKFEHLLQNNDPHFWLSPKVYERSAEAVANQFSKLDPQNASFYAKNLNVLKTKIAGLNEKYQEGLNGCGRKDFIITHEAFTYLAREYGLRQVGISGISPDKEPSAQELAAVADFARKNNIKYIFFETLISPKLAEAIAKEVGAQTLVLNPIEGLTRGEIASGKNYFTEMENNLNNLKTALECQ